MKDYGGLAPFMFVDEVTSLLGISRYRLRALVKQGKIRARGNGPGRRISRESVEESGLPIQIEIDWGDGYEKNS